MEYLYYFGNKLYDISNYIYKPFKSKYSSEEVYELIKNLKNVQSTISNRLELINQNIGKFLNKSKIEYSNKNNKGAIHYLKIKKLYEKEKEKLESVNFNIEVQIMSVESMGLMIETTETLKSTSIQIKSINNNIDVDKIESTIDELQDQNEIGKELQEIISNPLEHNFDDEELLKELEETTEINNSEINNLEINNLEINNLEINNSEINDESNSKIINLPIAPTHSLPDNNNKPPENDIKIPLLNS